MKRMHSKLLFAFIPFCLFSCYRKDLDDPHPIVLKYSEEITFREINYSFVKIYEFGTKELIEILDTIIAYTVSKVDLIYYKSLDDGNEYVDLSFYHEWEPVVPVYSVKEVSWEKRICIVSTFWAVLYQSEEIL
ncbi:MAG: hypothetical protein K6E11_00020 [Bacilli bacterium]|nr:hypothetical protein [Bacilli bacterium]